MNIAFGWLWITAGFLSGMVLGLFFHRENWLGGYSSFRRRMVRLGHIAMVALGAINILFGLTVGQAQLAAWERSLAGAAFLIGGVAMPAVCGLTAWRQPFKSLFVIPVAALLVGALTISRGFLRF